MLFGSDFPLLTPERWLRDFAGLDIDDAVRPKVLKQNALTALKLPQPGAVAGAVPNPGGTDS